MLPLMTNDCVKSLMTFSLMLLIWPVRPLRTTLLESDPENIGLWVDLGWTRRPPPRGGARRHRLYFADRSVSGLAAAATRPSRLRQETHGNVARTFGPAL